MQCHLRPEKQDFKSHGGERELNILRDARTSARGAVRLSALHCGRGRGVCREENEKRKSGSMRLLGKPNKQSEACGRSFL